mgnify:CR=1 FL=1
MNWLNFVFSFPLLVFMPLPNSAAKEEDPVASSRTVFLSRLSMMMFAMVVMLMLMEGSYIATTLFLYAIQPKTL